MRDAIKMLLTLVIVGIISGSVLANVYNYARPLIEENEKKAFREEGLRKVLLNAVRYDEIKKEKVTLYEGKDKRGSIIGYAFIAEGSGYQGKIKIVAAIDPKLDKLLGMEVLESSETPGLGAEIANEPFKKQLRGLSILPEIIFTKGKVSADNEIQAITGATISTRSLVEILNNEIALVRGALLN